MSNFTLVLFVTLLTFTYSSARFKIASRIIGGEDATPHKYPGLVWISPQLPNSKPFCGGSILNSEWIMTAAHCMTKVLGVLGDGNLKVWRIVAGAHRQRVHEPFQQFVFMSKVIIHPNFTEFPEMDNDMALVKVSPSFQFDNYVQPIPYAGKDFDELDFTGNKAIVAGWGWTSTDIQNSDSSVLKIAPLKFLKLEKCQQIFQHGPTIQSSQMCTVDASPKNNGRNGAYKGDSGGPLMCQSRNGKVTVACGIVSFGSDSLNFKIPTVFTRVSSFSDFIIENTGISSYKKEEQQQVIIGCAAHAAQMQMYCSVLTSLTILTYIFAV